MKKKTEFMINALEQAEKKAKKRDFEKDEVERKKIEETKDSLLKDLERLTGEKHYIGTEKNIFAGEPFSQNMHRNLDLLVQIDYLTQAEESFLFRVQNYLEFKTNVILKREDKFSPKKKKDEEFTLARSATVSDIAEMIGKSRTATSLIMNSLKEKEILLNPEGAGLITENGRSVSPRTWIVNPYIIICAPRARTVELDGLTMRLFQHSLKRLKDQNGKKVSLPSRFF
ncbi:Rep protein [Halalkalibacter lacteus]|uniref:Rep protein n=1 Tax=Halalkalibacter lacteus TaxID=3090663 RepID=UPI002FCC3279